MYKGHCYAELDIQRNRFNKKKNVNKYKDYNTLNKEYATYVYG